MHIPALFQVGGSPDLLKVVHLQHIANPSNSHLHFV
jgi:hypothetical protein